MTYFNSEEHKQNMERARIKALASVQERKKQRIAAYNVNPSKCLCCEEALPYNRKSNKFCSKSCNATFNNKNRSPELLQTRNKKISATLVRKNSSGEIPKRAGNNAKMCKLEFKTCSVCGTIFYTKTWCNPRKTCSRTCQTHASVGIRSYQNGSRKSFRYFNKTAGREVILESSWEVYVAELLDSLDIDWVRPTPITWVDEDGKVRLYYPDFYLPNFDVYLDPKNPYCMAKDKLKIANVAMKINLKVGSLKFIESYIHQLKN